VTRIVVDADRCEGHGLCQQIAPEVFDLDDDGYLHLLRDTVGAELDARVRDAVRVCPVAALTTQP